MGTLMKARLALKTDRELHSHLVRGSRNEILIDLDGDKEADIALVIDKDGNIDRFAVDITGNGYFDLYIDDTDGNGIPDHIFKVDEENDKVEDLAAGPEVEAHILAAAEKIAFVLEAKEIIAEELDTRLQEMDTSIRAVRKELAKHY